MNKANGSHVGPKPMGECPPWGVFLRDSNPYLRKFPRKPLKTPNGQVDKAGNRTRHLLSISFECRTVLPLVGLFNIGKFNISFYPIHFLSNCM